MFFEDAVNISRELELTLTSKNAGLEERIPMCGIPYHAAKLYIDKLVEKGYKVGICEQLENPGEGDNYFVDVYRYTLDVTEQDVHLQTEETDGCRFATPEEIRELADQGIFLHYDSIKRVFED